MNKKDKVLWHIMWLGTIYHYKVPLFFWFHHFSFCICLLEIKDATISYCNFLSNKFIKYFFFFFFQRFILFCILTNTFSMGIEYHSQPEWLTKTVEISNLAFSIIFAVEMVLKLCALGFFCYISDGFNVFDGVIVILRYVFQFIFLICYQIL